MAAPSTSSDGMQAQGPLVIIGGHEDKEAKRTILKQIARRIGDGKLVICTVASHQPDGYFEAYQKAFADLGVQDLVELYVGERPETLSKAVSAALDGATGVFFTGGDQLRISSQIGDTPVERRVREIHAAGGVIAGTSAGASVMSDTMWCVVPAPKATRSAISTWLLASA